MTVVTAPAVSIGRAYCPGHITGFLAKATYLRCPSENDPYIGSYLKMGSTGAGVAIGLGLSSYVMAQENQDKSLSTTYDVYMNGSKIKFNFEVTKSVVEKYISLLQGKSYYIKIEHESDLPIGFGLSSSGAAALSLSYALNVALKVGLNSEQAAQIAHCSEIECRTGLGSVLAQYVGGFELRSAIGAPGVGIANRIESSSMQDLKVVILCISPMPTREFLSHNIIELNG
ncbi:MAG: hypothetical protein M3297_05110, partial [Thermoproteota archaeon]|nr:hypothetical protein [Thermoproteota archaeon]